MGNPPAVANESQRLIALSRYGILDTPPEPDFDDLAQLAGEICQAPIALVSIVDERRQWFKARVGMEETETPREISFCWHALDAPDLFVVPDATQDARFSDSPLVTDNPRVRFYAGAPLRTPDGLALGALCVMDRSPRELSAAQQTALRTLGRQVMAQLELRRRFMDLRDAATLTGDILNSLASNVAVLDANGVIIRVNESWRRFSSENGAPGNTDFIGTNYLSACQTGAHFRDSEYSAAAVTGIRAVLDGSKHECVLEYPCHSPSLERWFVMRVTRLSGAQPGVVVAHLDITEQKQAERAAHHLGAIVEFSEDAIIGKDLRSIVVSWNHGAEKIFGYRADEMVGGSIMRIIPDDRQAEEDFILGEIRNGRSVEHFETKRLTKSGKLIDVSITVSPVKGRDGRVTGVSKVARDITARHASEEHVRQQAALLDKARDAILVRDLEHRISFWNKSAERLYGWTAEEAIGSSIKDLLYADPAAFLAATESALANGEWSGEIEQKARDGRRLVVEARWTVVRDNQGRPKSILAINTDVTERKKLDQQFLRAQRMESIGTLAGGIAHDLNNVLAPILMSLDLLQMRFTDEESQNLIGILASSAQRGSDMVRQVLSFARGLAGKRLEVQVRHLVRDIEKIVNETFLKHVSMRTSVPRDLWSVVGDATQLHQVLLNLCVNARDAMPNGGTLTILAENVILDAHYAGLCVEATAGPYVTIEVEDTGTGMPAEIVEKIFDPFFTTKEIGKGTGLGLSTTLAIIKSHGGFIRVYSELNKGTRFQVFLPANTEKSATDAATAETEMPRGNGETILVVDDEASVRQITQQTLEAFGYRVILACDGAEALALYSQRQAEINVVLTDMMMPVMDGPAIIQVLRRINPNLPIIAASGLSSDDRADRAVAAGAKHFLPKPFTAQALLKILRQILSAPAV